MTRTARLDRSLVAPIAAIRKNPGSRIEVETTVPAQGLLVSASHVPDQSPVEVDLVLESVHEGILVSGTVLAHWEGECRRCLEEATGTLEVSVRELCTDGASEDDETAYPIENDEVDLGVIVHDACILDLPLAPLCREDCRGLCPECGANRNFEPCPHAAQHLAVIEGGSGAEQDNEAARPPEDL